MAAPSGSVGSLLAACQPAQTPSAAKMLPSLTIVDAGTLGSKAPRRRCQSDCRGASPATSVLRPRCGGRKPSRFRTLYFSCVCRVRRGKAGRSRQTLTPIRRSAGAALRAAAAAAGNGGGATASVAAAHPEDVIQRQLYRLPARLVVSILHDVSAKGHRKCGTCLLSARRAGSLQAHGSGRGSSSGRERHAPAARDATPAPPGSCVPPAPPQSWPRG